MRREAHSSEQMDGQVVLLYGEEDLLWIIGQEDISHIYPERLRIDRSFPLPFHQIRPCR